jgi:TrmH family RNA methyltransferase
MTTMRVQAHRLLINGEWRDATGGETIDVINPATEEIIATVPAATTADVDAAVAAARSQRCRIVATVARGGRSFFEADYTGAVAILIGGEGSGLTEPMLAAADERVTIPMQPPVESLNAAVTAAVIVYEARRQRS